MCMCIVYTIHCIVYTIHYTLYIIYITIQFLGPRTFNSAQPLIKNGAFLYYILFIYVCKMCVKCECILWYCAVIQVVWLVQY